MFPKKKFPDKIGVFKAGMGRDNAENFDLKDEKWKNRSTVG